MKKRVPSRTLGPGAAVILCGLARAQDTAAPIRLSIVPPPPGAALNGEAVVIASALHPDEVIVAWNQFPVPLSNPSRIHYRVSTTGFVAQPPDDPLVLPFPNALGNCTPCGDWHNSGDPAVARLDADLLLGGVFVQQSGTMLSSTLGIARKRANAAFLEGIGAGATTPLVRSTSPACFGFFDRPSLATGPRPPDLPSYPANVALYFTSGVLAVPGEEESRLYSARAVPIASRSEFAWECNPANPQNGYPAEIATDPAAPHVARAFGNPCVVVHSGTRAGRLIMASSRITGSPKVPGYQLVTSSPPESTWTDQGGGPFVAAPYSSPWADARLLNAYGSVNTAVEGVRDGPNGAIPVPSDIALQFKSTPSIATDPNDPSNVFAAFSGRSADTPDRVDLFIAWTNTGNAVGGPVFQGVAVPEGPTRQTYLVQDAWLQVPGDPDAGSGWQAEQFMPMITIDGLGGINLLFCQAHQCVQCESLTQPTMFTTRYARWPSLQALHDGHPPALRVLSAPSARWPMAAGHDYLGLSASQCVVYATWAGNHSGNWHTYLTRILLPCTADADDSGAVDADDPIAFAMQVAAQTPTADVNGDGSIDSRDYSAFLAAYACRVCPPCP